MAESLADSLDVARGITGNVDGFDLFASAQVAGALIVDCAVGFGDSLSVAEATKRESLVSASREALVGSVSVFESSIESWVKFVDSPTSASILGTQSKTLMAAEYIVQVI